jgi:hypothetical protein
MKLVTPHFLAWRGTGSRSLFVLWMQHQPSIVFFERSLYRDDAYQRAFPSAKADFVCATLSEKFGFSKTGIVQIYFDFFEIFDQLFANATDMGAFLS